MRKLLAHIPAPERVAIVGGALFPRTALLLQELLPSARLTVIDADAGNIEAARGWVRGVEFVHARFPECGTAGYDLVVIPLSFDGGRGPIERDPPAPCVLLHDWIWRPRGESRVISWALLKRLNLIRRVT
jgi:hypothetical protein